MFDWYFKIDIIYVTTGAEEIIVGVYEDTEGLIRHNKYHKKFTLQPNTGLDSHFSMSWKGYRLL